MFASITEYGVTGRAYQQKIWQFAAINRVDLLIINLVILTDRPFGGGVGMVMMLGEPLLKSIDFVKQNISGSLKKTRVIYLSPQGVSLTHQKTVELSPVDNLILLCGRYGRRWWACYQQCWWRNQYWRFCGVRWRAACNDFWWMVLRFVPNVLGEITSAEQDCAGGLLGLSTLHAQQNSRAWLCARSFNFREIIRWLLEWRLKQSLRRTLMRRPDLLEKARFTPKIRLLAEIRAESNGYKSILY